MFLVREDFFKNINPQLVGNIKDKLESFSNELINNSYRNMSHGDYVRKIKECSKSIYKFRLNIGDRILFAYGKDINNIRPQYENSIIFLDYRTHDKQTENINRRYEKINVEQIEMNMEDYEESAEEIEEDNNRRIIYDINNDKTIVVSDESYIELLDSDNNAYLYYINDDQYNILRKNPPVILTGSAGSGKTTVGIYKLLDIDDSYENIGYFTYTENLKNLAKKIYTNYSEHVSKNKGHTGQKVRRVNFYVLNDFCMNANGLDYTNLVKFERFEEWYEKNQNKIGTGHKFYSMDIWEEIKGIIKGFMGLNWIRQNNFKNDIASNITLNFLINNKFITPSQKCKNEYLVNNISLDDIIKVINSSGGVNRSIIKKETKKIFENLRSNNLNTNIISEETYLSFLIHIQYMIQTREKKFIILP